LFDYLLEHFGPGNLTLASLLLFILVLIPIGALVPANLHKQAIRDRDAQIEEWRQIHANDLETNQELMRSLVRMLDASGTTTELIDVLRQEVLNNRVQDEARMKSDIAGIAARGKNASGLRLSRRIVTRTQRETSPKPDGDNGEHSHVD